MDYNIFLDATTNENASAADLMTTADDENREEHMRKVFKVIFYMNFFISTFI